MERLVKVESINPDGTAQVVCQRTSACGENCAHCGGCGDGQRTIRVTANNSLGASPGDMVLLRSSTGQTLALVWLVYLLPAVLLIAGCALWGLFGGLAGLGAGVLGVVALDRLRGRKKRLSHTICAYAQELGGQQ